jgi:hypothetical protein
VSLFPNDTCREMITVHSYLVVRVAPFRAYLSRHVLVYRRSSPHKVFSRKFHYNSTESDFKYIFNTSILDAITSYIKRQGKYLLAESVNLARERPGARHLDH